MSRRRQKSRPTHPNGLSRGAYRLPDGNFSSSLHMTAQRRVGHSSSVVSSTVMIAILSASRVRCWK